MASFYWLYSPKEAPAQLQFGSWPITEATNSSIFIYFQPYLHILSSVLKRAIPSQKSLQTNTKQKIVHLTSSAEVPRRGSANSQNSTGDVFQTSSTIYIHVTLDWPNFIGSLFSWVLDPPAVYSSASAYPICLSTNILCLIQLLVWK